MMSAELRSPVIFTLTDYTIQRSISIDTNQHTTDTLNSIYLPLLEDRLNSQRT